MTTNFRNRSQMYRSRRAVPSRKEKSSSMIFRKFGRNVILPIVFISICLYFFALTHLLSSNEKYSHKSEHYHPLSIRQEISHYWTQRMSQNLRKVEDPDSNFGHVGDTVKKANDHNNGYKINNNQSINKDKQLSLIDASRDHIECEENVDNLVYWNDPQGISDRNFTSVFLDDSETKRAKYVTFDPDSNGWNHRRMIMEIVFVFAAATGRTVVLPPDQPIEFLNEDTTRNARGFADFFPLEAPNLLKQVPIITSEQFLALERADGGLFSMNMNDEKILVATRNCVNDENEENFCENLYDFYIKNGYVMPVSGSKNCIIFDENAFELNEISPSVTEHINKFCGNNRSPIFYTVEHREKPIIHFAAHQPETSLLNHFYSFILFTDPTVDNHYKRFVRDFLHYRSYIFCAAGKIIQKLQKEGETLGFPTSHDGSGGFSSLHVRRGDFQFKDQLLSAEQWQENTKDLFHKGEILYITTDEKDKEFFRPMKDIYELRFLDDFWNDIGLNGVDPNSKGMIEVIVASRGRAFVGTWSSSFTGYINRLRGYYGMALTNSWYGYEEKKYDMHEWTYPYFPYVSREWPLGWDRIDGNEFIEESETIKSLGRGVSGLPFKSTPALIGAQRAHIECDVDVDALAYWNDPQGISDINFKSPFQSNIQGETKYLTFEPDSGGWNNIRMSMEIIFIFAAATGRTLVMPPDQPLYLLNADTTVRSRGFANFFPLDKPELRKHLNIISTEEFIRLEGGDNGKYPIPPDDKDKVLNAQKHCSKRMKNKDACDPLIKYLRSIGLVPELSQSNCLIFDESAFRGESIPTSLKEQVDVFCGKRKQVIYDSTLHDAPLIHLQASQRDYRLLSHFYGFLLFTNPITDNFYKRFVRDFLHYHDSIYCAAGKIVLELQRESKRRGFDIDSEGGGGYSSFHVRRGDLQYKKVKIPADEWEENTRELFLEKEILYIATDERDKTFFDPLAKQHDLKFLDDYWDFAGLGNLDPNYMGMIDTIIASRGRVFVGTYFSTFSGYINRMRGYHGMTMKKSYYGTKDRKTAVHTWGTIPGSVFAKEWPTGWIGIDGDTLVSQEKF